MDGQSAVGTAGCARGASRKEEAAMDTYLRSQGLYRKKIAKDGSCLFRAVAEKVLRSQACHLEIRKSCISYLRKNRDQYEAFIEGSFEDYLKRLENPQEWVGQVEISALSLMFKRDFVIYQEPNIPPAYVTENDFSDKILLCFSNGNHYDIIYPIGFEENAAVCQSLIYELLYDKVLGVNVTKQMLKADICDLNAEEELFDSGGSESDLEDDVASGKNFADMNGFKSHKDKQKKNGNLIVSQNVLRSLNPLVYRNVEYEVWLKSQRAQQKLDFSIAAGMQYSVGDKCKVRLQPGGKFFNAHIQEVGAENGPVVVFVEELGMKHTVQLKNLKPIPLTINSSDGWNTVAGKRIKKTSTSGLNVQAERDYRGQKGPIKVPPKPQAAPPRLQQAAINKQQGFSSHPQDHATLGENKGRSRTPPKVPGRKLERERGNDYSKRESVHFGLTPEERREKQVIEESKSLYEMQSRDEDAFPALSTALLDQTTEASSVKKTPHLNTEKSTRRKSDGEDQRDKASKLIQPAKVKDVKAAEEETKDIATSGVDDLHEVLVLPDPSEHQTPTTVPSVPIIAPAWSGIQAQIPASPGLGPDSSMLQPQVTSAPFTPLPVSMPAVNQPILPLPQTLSAYQDPLYPGFPFNEKGETTVAPPYSFCKDGSDLPNDKSILRFFYNLGVKAYTCPMWPPHSYLYPLHQAYLNMCRMYPNIPLYPQSHWVQDTSVNQTEVNPSLLVHQSEMSMESQCSQGAAFTSLVQSSAEQIAHQTGSAVNNQAQLPSNDFEVALAGKSVFPQATFGQGSYMGTVPIAPLFPQLWYGYPYQGYLDNPAVRPNVFMAPQDSDTSESLLTGVDVGNNSNFQGAIKQSLDSVSECKLDKSPLLVDATSSDSVSNTPSVKKDVQLLTSNAEQVAVEQQNFAVKDKHAPPGIFMQTSDIECATSECKDSTEKEIDLVASETLQPSPAEECSLQTKEESSEDEQEVSSMLSSGRSKNYYSQSFGVRRPRNNRFYQTNRGGYQPARNEDGWRGPRGREDSYQRNFRGRPNRRRPMGDMYRGHHD